MGKVCRMDERQKNAKIVQIQKSNSRRPVEADRQIFPDIFDCNKKTHKYLE